VIVVLLANIGSNLAGSGYGVPFTHYSLFMALPISCWCLYQAQSLANFASDDVNANSNNKLTLVNYIWLALGLIIWFLNIIGLYLMPVGA
jgi:hypothetical protein